MFQVKTRPRTHPLGWGASLASAAEHVPADGGDDRAGADPLVGRGLGIVIIDRATRWIPAVEGILRRPVSALRNRLVKLSVIETGKRALLIDHPG